MGLFDSPTHLLIILVVLVVLFGSAKLPKAAKSMGEAMRIFKKESAKLHEEDGSAAPQFPASPVQQGIAPPQQVYTQQVPGQQPVYTQQVPGQQPVYTQQVPGQQPVAQQPMMAQPQMAQPQMAPQPTVIQPEAQQTNQPS
jgi:sec-independent protein translocase protein TatA